MIGVMRPRSLLIILAAPALVAQSLTGVLDLHVHSDPDSVPRSIDAIGAARLAKQRGMRGLLLKNHYEPTASLAYEVRQVVPGIELFGGIALNRTVGGINPAAVERMTMVKGGWGRVVWMPTFDSENQVRSSGEKRPFVSVSRSGKLLPEVMEVLKVIARRQLVLETGHSTPEENLMLIREAKRLGIAKIIVTHPLTPPVKMSDAQIREAAKLGAFLEFPYLPLIDKQQFIPLERYALAIRAAGVDRAILSSDLGQAGNPLHPDGMADYFVRLRSAGFSVADIEKMSKRNPARAMGLE